MRNKKYILPILGITTLTTITAPVIASCSCSVVKHVSYSPVMDRRQYANEEAKGLFICVLDKDDYNQKDLNITITGDYANILTIDSVKVNLKTVEVYVKCLDKTKDGEIPFGLTFKTNKWEESVTDLVLVVTANIDHIEISGSDDITFGGSEQYTAKAVDKEGAEVEVEFVWSISAGSDKAQIESTAGKTATVKGVGPGDATIKVGIKNAASITPATKNVSVKALPATDVSITGNDKILLNTSEVYTATVSPIPGAIQKVTWSVEQKTAQYPGEVEIVPGTEKDNTISLKGLSQGSIKLTATVPETSIKHEKIIEVKNPGVEGITVAGTTEFYSGDANKFIATITPAKATKVVTWSVHDSETATEPSTKATITKDADGNGVITVNSGQENGFELYVRATATDGTQITGQTKTKVKIPLTGFAIDGEQIARLNSGTYQYTVKDITPSGASYDPDSIEWVLPSTETKASIVKNESGNGELTPLVYGGETPVTITAKLKSKTTVSATLDVKILDALVTELTIGGPEEIWTDETDSAKLTYTVTEYKPGASHEGVTWHAYNDGETTESQKIKVTTVDGDTGGLESYDGSATLPAGKYKIKAVANDQGTSGAESNIISLNIKQAATSIETPRGDASPKVGGGTYTYTSAVHPTAAEGVVPEGTLVYSVENGDTNPGVAGMTSTGVLTPKTKGSMKVRATFKQEGRTDLISEPLDITIQAPDLISISINGSPNISIADSNVGYSIKLNPGEAEIADENITWEVIGGTPGSATLDTTTGKSVKLTPTAAGNVTLKATAQGITDPATLPIFIGSTWTDIFTYTESAGEKTVTGFTTDYGTKIGGYIQSGSKTLVFPSDPSVVAIADEAFKDKINSDSGCAQSGIEINKIIIPANITSIGDNAFNNATEPTKSIIQAVEIQGATEIGKDAFINEDALTALTATNGVTINARAFKGNKVLANIDLGENTSTVINEEAFAELKASSITLSANPKTIGQEAFSKSKGLAWSGEHNINNAYAITNIGVGAFTACKLLPDTDTLKITNILANATIGDAAFFGSGIEKIWLPEQTTDTMYANWGRTLFAQCKSLKEIDLSDWSSIPSNLQKEGLDLFLLSGPDTDPKNQWIVLTEPKIAAFQEWMDTQFGDTADRWEGKSKE